METKTFLRKPFHELIVDIIEQCTSDDASLLANIINGTKISENHEAIILALEKKAEIFGQDYLKIVNGVLAQKPIDYKLVMNSAKSLEEALEFGFDVLPLGSRYLGPQGKILLVRNILAKGDPYVAEICVMDARANPSKILASAGWGKNEEHYHLRYNPPVDPKELSNQW